MVYDGNGQSARKEDVYEAPKLNKRNTSIERILQSNL